MDPDPIPWEEALDVDDSDLSLFLRPCKQGRHGITIPETTNYHPYLQHSSQTLDSNPSHQTLDSTSQLFNSTPQAQATTAPTFSLIPGPAGVVQAAMLRKARDIRNNSSPMPTQEYIRKAIEVAGEDDDFKRNPWLSAIDFINRIDGAGNGGIPIVPLGYVRKYLKNGKLDKVVAVVKSCSPNGLGDLLVTLKDPTGKASGTIHYKVLAEGDFAKDISVGSVLILQKVSAFSPSRSAHYLNITLNNVVKVFRKDGETPLNQNYHASAANPGSGEHLPLEGSGEARMLQKAFSLEQVGIGGTQGIMNEGTKRDNVKESVNMDNHQDEGNISRSSVSCLSKRSDKNMNQNVAVSKEPSLLREGSTTGISKEAESMEIVEDDGPNELCPDMVEKHKEKKIRGADSDQKQIEPPVAASATLLQWTDEQLNELFALDCDDDDPFF